MSWAPVGPFNPDNQLVLWIPVARGSRLRQKLRSIIKDRSTSRIFSSRSVITQVSGVWLCDGRVELAQEGVDGDSLLVPRHSSFMRNTAGGVKKSIFWRPPYMCLLAPLGPVKPARVPANLQSPSARGRATHGADTIDIGVQALQMSGR